MPNTSAAASTAAPSRPPMAVVVDHRHYPFKPTPRNRRHRLLSFPHIDLNLMHLLSSPLPPADEPAPFHRSRSTPCLSTADADTQLHPARVEILMGRKSPAIHALVIEVAISMAYGILPVPSPAGPSSAYYLRNRAGRNFAVLKPAGNGTPGEAGVREAAAYLLDHNGFSGVPPTAVIRVSHAAFRRRTASIQRFVPHSCDAGDFGPSRFSVASVHRIGILDVRLLNIDRHSGNMLVRSSGTGDVSPATEELVPIDHGLCLPELLEDPYFEWLHWPQALVPFSEAEAEYIASLDPHDDAELLRAELPSLREPSIRVLMLCTTFLKKAAAGGLRLADIGGMMTRGFSVAATSSLEAICRQVRRRTRAEEEEKEGEREEEWKKGMSFKAMGADEWEKFMDRFDEAVTEAVEARSKEVLGRACML